MAFAGKYSIMTTSSGDWMYEYMAPLALIDVSIFSRHELINLFVPFSEEKKSFLSEQVRFKEK